MLEKIAIFLSVNYLQLEYNQGRRKGRVEGVGVRAEISAKKDF